VKICLYLSNFYSIQANLLHGEFICRGLKEKKPLFPSGT
jgi:hypothetical protein